MLKKISVTAAALLFSASSLAAIEVTVINKSRVYDANLKGKESQASIYSPAPQNSVIANGNDNFKIYSRFPDVVFYADLDYGYDRRGPKCEFNFVVMKDWRSGKMLPGRATAKATGGSYRDKTRCTAKIDSFNLATGDAKVTFTIDRRKY